MSLDIAVYTARLDDSLIPKIQKRLNDFEMICEIHPETSFADTGFVPFKFQLTNAPFEILRNKVLLSGFELYVEDFDLEEAKKQNSPKPGLVDKLFGRKQTIMPFVDERIDARLKPCNKVVRFVWHGGESFQLRFASLASAILTELTNGVCTYPADDIWYENQNLVQTAWADVKEYEASLEESDLDFNEFESWEA